MMKLWGALLCVFIPISTLIAQNSISGVVSDSVGRGIPNVTISVIDSTTGAVVAFDMSNIEGAYHVKYMTTINHVYLLKAAHIGYGVREKRIKNDRTVYNFTLYVQIFTLPDVIVHEQKLLIFSNDTLSYDVKGFSRPQDKTIGDVIKNLPGITVNPSGTISYNGKPINEFYIDGDDLLGTKYGIATNTLPANVVDKVQVLENHQPIKMLRNKVLSDDAAINIKLNDSAKLKLFGLGQASLGTPLNMSTDVKINTLLFKNHLKAINTYIYNDIGMNIKDQVSDQNTVVPGDVEKDKDKDFLSGFTRLQNPNIPQHYWYNNHTQLLTLNNLWKINDEKNIRFNFYWLPDIQNINYHATNTFYLPSDTIIQFENQNAKIRQQNYYFNITYLDNSNNHYLKNQFLVNNIHNDGTSSVTTEGGIFKPYLKQNNFKIEDIFSINKITKRNIIFGLNADIKYQRLPENLIVNPGLYDWLLNDSIPYLQTIQHVLQKGLNTNMEASLLKKFTNNLIGLKVIYYSDISDYTTNMLVADSNSTATDLGDSFKNNFHWNNQNILITPTYEFNKEKIKITSLFPFLYRYTKYKNAISNNDTESNTLFFQPQIKVSYDIGQYIEIVANWRRETSATIPENLLSGNILVNYRSINSYQQQLQYSTMNTYSLLLKYSNPIKIWFVNAGIIYSRHASPIMNAQTVQQSLIINSQIYFNNISDRIMFLSNISKYIFTWKTTLKFSYNSTFFKYYQYQNNVVSKLQSNSQNFSISVVAKPFEFINAELNSNLFISKTKNISLSQQIGVPLWLSNTDFTTTINLTTNLFVQVMANYVWQKNNLENIFTDAKINYTLAKSKMDFGIQVYNIFNQKRFIVSNINGLQFSTNNYWIRPLTFMAYATFRF